jgi:hypothetical protein
MGAAFHWDLTAPIPGVNRAALAAALGDQGLNVPRPEALLRHGLKPCPDTPPVERAWKPRRKLDFEFDPRCPAEDMGKDQGSRPGCHA